MQENNIIHKFIFGGGGLNTNPVFFILIMAMLNIMVGR